MVWSLLNASSNVSDFFAKQKRTTC
jgi:hypothetical protein